MRSRRTASVLVLSLVLAACAGTVEDDTTTTTATTAPPSTDAPATTTTTAPASTTTTEPAESSAETEVVIGLQLEPPTLDLTSSPAAAIPQVLLYNVYETLVKLEADGSITPLLAESWDLNDDGTVYTFTLRDGVTFHNGKALTADDVVFSIENVLTKDPAHPFATTLAPIETVEAVDERTVQITLSSFSSNLLFFLTQGQGVILDQAEIGSIDNSPVGTGPFRFSSWTVGDSIVLEKNPDYWGDEALLETVTFRYINDPNALNNALLAGDIDIIAGVSAPELLEVFEDDERFDVQTGLTNGEVTLAINAEHPPLDDLRVRQAILYAMDEQEIIDLAYFGYGVPIGSAATPLDPWYVDLTGVYPHDPAEAEALLADAGVTDLTLDLYLPPVSYARRGGEILASQLADVGIDVEINNVEWGVWLEDVFANKDYDLSRQVQEQITADAANGWLFLLPALSVTKAGITGYTSDLPGLSLDVTKLAFNP
jgi:peptide/nickel transport system substrate-binding protein